MAGVAGVQGAAPALARRLHPRLPGGPATDWLHQSKQTSRRVVATDQFTLTSLKGRPTTSLPPSFPFRGYNRLGREPITELKLTSKKLVERMSRGPEASLRPAKLVMKLEPQ